MAINADTLLERLYLKGQITKWRILAILFALVALVVTIERFNPKSGLEREYIARISVEGFVGDDRKFYELIDDVADNPKAKAVIVWLDTPGGSAIGGEEIFLRLRSLSQKKPVVAVMRSVSASAGYMIALGTDRIFARDGTITGSIGVLIESVEATELAQKIGITPIIVKSTPLKGSPSPLEKMTPEAQRSLQVLIDDFYARFVDMVVDRRKMPRDRVISLADGRVYSGRNALQNNLIDAIGGEEEAVKWLAQEKKIKQDLEIKDIELEAEADFIEKLTQSVAGFFWQKGRVPLDGLAAIWHPNLN